MHPGIREGPSTHNPGDQQAFTNNWQRQGDHCAVVPAQHVVLEAQS